MRAKMLLFVGIAVLSAWMAQARDPVPVYGPARVAVEDVDLLGDTILELGTLAVTPGEIWKVVIGDGLTPGGIPIHPENCVTGFNGVAIATTNLDMRSWSIKWGPWQAHGDANEWDLGYGSDETWLRLVRDSGQAYLAYTFTIVDAMHYRFELAWTVDSEAFPVLQVATNLAAVFDAYVSADPADVTYTQPDASHLVIDYAVPADYAFLSFRLFTASRLESGAYFSVPVHATGALTLDGTNVATVDDVEGVADDLAAHEADTNAHAAAINNYLAGHGIKADPYFGNPASNDGVEYLAGWGNYFSFELSEWWRPIGTDFTFWATNSTWVFRTPTRPRWRRNVGGQSEDFGLATTNDIALHAARQDNPHAVSADQAGALPATKRPLGTYLVADNVIFDGDVSTEGGASVGGDLDVGGNLSAWSLTVGTRTTTDLSEFATTQAVASVDRRVGLLERTDTCLLWWTTNLTSDTTYWVPTNFPTRRLEIRADRAGLTNLVIAVNGAYDYGRDVQIDVIFCATTAGHGIVRCMGEGGGYVSMGNVSGTTSRSYTFEFDNVTKTMRALGMSPSITAANMLTVTYADGGATSTPTGPCSVEEWLVLHPEWATP